MARNRRHRTRRSRGGKRRRPFLFAALLAAAATVGFATTQAFTASNAVPATKIGAYTHTIAPSDLEPAECKANGITVTSIASGTSSATSNQLVLGTSGNDFMYDSHGSACLVGGAGRDTFWGQTGDLCVASNASTFVFRCQVVARRP
jgi:hypothetical protein